MSPHETIARMRAYQAALNLVLIDIRTEQYKETQPDKIDETIRTLRRRNPMLSEQELELAAAESNDKELGFLMGYVNEVSGLHAQLQKVIDNPSLLARVARDKLVDYPRMRSILRRALHRCSVEHGWFLDQLEVEDAPRDSDVRIQKLHRRIAAFSRALHFQTGNVCQPMSIHTLFRDFEQI